MSTKQDSSNTVALTLRILSPHDGDVFLLDPKDKEGQKLLFRVSELANQPIEWRLNGKILAVDSASFAWQLRPGNWTLEVKIGEMSDRVNFQVDLPKSRINRRGFSVEGINKKSDQ